MYNQEYIVDEIIKKDLTKQYPELKKLIKKTSPHEIRGGIMSVLDKDRMVHRDIKFYENLNKECEYNTYTDEIVINVRKYIEVADCEVKLYAEVMTPIELVEDMLDTLPDDVWTNKDLKWFDPCAGVGTFPSVIVQRLMKGLKTQIPNPKKRYKHIIEEMIYVCELQAKNLFAFHYVFDKPDIYELNTFYGSFLTDEFNEHMKNEWNIDKFDIIVANPPYQSDNNKSNKLWVKFISKSIELSENLCYVVPQSLMTSESKQITDIRKKLSNKKNIFNLTKKDIFNVGEKVVYFTSVFSKTNETNIIFPNGNLKKVDNLIERQPIENDDDLKLSIFRKIENSINKNEYVYDFNPNSNKTTPSRLIEQGLVSENKDDEIFKYKVHHSASKILYSKVLISEYSKNNETTYGKLKVILNFSGGFIGNKYMFLSTNMIGKQMLGILVKNRNEGNNLINLYSSKLFNWYINSEKSGGFNTGIFKLPKLDFTIDWTNEQLYTYFKLTQEEINLIESQTK